MVLFYNFSISLFTIYIIVWRQYKNIIPVLIILIGCVYTFFKGYAVMSHCMASVIAVLALWLFIVNPRLYKYALLVILILSTVVFDADIFRFVPDIHEVYWRIGNWRIAFQPYGLLLCLMVYLMNSVVIHQKVIRVARLMFYNKNSTSDTEINDFKFKYESYSVAELKLIIDSDKYTVSAKLAARTLLQAKENNNTNSKHNGAEKRL